jgi:hypothetical protein
MGADLRYWGLSCVIAAMRAVASNCARLVDAHALSHFAIVARPNPAAIARQVPQPPITCRAPFRGAAA